MKFPKIVTCRNEDSITVTAYLHDKTYGGIDKIELVEKAKICCAFTNSTQIGFNLDVLIKPYHLFCFPQRVLHEFIHFYFPFFMITVLVHKISRKTRGLII
jgi:hypothetical protein